MYSKGAGSGKGKPQRIFPKAEKPNVPYCDKDKQKNNNNIRLWNVLPRKGRILRRKRIKTLYIRLFFVAPNKNRKLTHLGCFVSIYYLSPHKKVFGCYTKHPKRRFYL